jgi:hypothetical protein
MIIFQIPISCGTKMAPVITLVKKSGDRDDFICPSWQGGVYGRVSDSIGFRHW